MPAHETVTLSPRPSPSQSRSKDRVEAIFEATRTLLREGGMARCTVAAISAQAGISPASLYRYFPDATAVLYALAAASLDEVHRAFQSLLATIKRREDIEPILLVALEGYFSFFVNDRAARELWFGTLADPRLVALNVEDSRRNGLLFAETLSSYVDTPIAQLRDKWFLLSHMIGAAIGLFLEVPPRQQKRLRSELDRMLPSILAL